VRRLLIILTLCVGCVIVADAQSTFTERLQKSNSGEGKITVTHDQSIDELVNGKNAVPVQAAPKKQTETTKKQSETTKKQTETTTATTRQENTRDEKNEQAAALQETETTTATPDTIDTRKKVMKGYKINGFRVQVFAGGNSRNDRVKAERTGNEIKSLFPGEPVYVHFYSPRWICRMGNYRTYEEAHAILRSVRELGYQSAIIVKGKITVQYP
jgi:TolA-binding protein